MNFIIIVAITEVTKPFSGRLRPDFLSRCHPPDFEGASSDVNTLLSDHAASLGKLYVGQVAGACTNPNQDIINDGRLVSCWRLGAAQRSLLTKAHYRTRLVDKWPADLDASVLLVLFARGKLSPQHMHVVV